MDVLAPTPAPAPVPVPAPNSGGIGWFTIFLFVSAIGLLAAIVIIGINIGLFRQAPKEEKETFIVMNTDPAPSCNTKDTYAIFPSL